jgi:hypothetical protein
VGTGGGIMPTKTDVTITLKKVRELISDENHWTKYAEARNAYGGYCDPTDPEAVKFCLTGALTFVAGNEEAYNAAYARLAKATLGPDNVSEFNDMHQHRDVLKALDKAIAMEERMREITLQLKVTVPLGVGESAVTRAINEALDESETLGGVRDTWLVGPVMVTDAKYVEVDEEEVDDNE